MSSVTVQCDRCEDWVEGVESIFMTGGYYNTGPNSYWNRFANENELVVCDPCMHKEPRYLEVYGGTA